MSEHQRAGGAACSWNPEVFRPAVVSCYSREIFSEDAYNVGTSPKPGQGFKKPECGKWIRKLQSGDEVRDIYHNCGNLSCPVCMPGTITDKAHDIEERFNQYEQAKTAENAVLIPGEIRGVVPRQFIFTITPAHQMELVSRVIRTSGRWVPSFFLRLVREEYTQALKYTGLIGGLTVYHDARVRHPDTGETGKRGKHLITMEAKVAGNMADCDPSWKIYDHIRKQKRPGRYYYFAPHFHAIAFGMAIDVQEFEKLMPGWTYHNKGNVKNPGGLGRYLISHMAMIDGMKSVSWFGRLSSVSLGKKELRTVDKIAVHPETGCPWVIVDSVIPEEIGSNYHISDTIWHVFFRDKRKYTPPDRGKLIFPKSEKRSAAPPGMREKGVLAMTNYCDEFGKI